MFRELTLSALAVFMIASNAAAASNERAAKSEKEKAEAAKVATDAKSRAETTKSERLDARVESTVQKLVKLAKDSGDAKTIKLMESLQVVIKEKSTNGLAETSKPQRVVAEIRDLIEAGKSPKEATETIFAKEGVREDKLIECARK